VPYREPVTGGYYGGHIGITGNWANLTGCHKIVVWSAANSAQANNNYTWSGGGGSYNGYGDFDQIDANRTP